MFSAFKPIYHSLLRCRHRHKHLNKSSDEDETKEEEVDPKSRLNHRINPAIEIELSDMHSTPKPNERQIDYGILECVIPIMYTFSFAAFTNDTQLVVGSLVSILLLYTKFCDTIPNVVRFLAVIGITAVVIYSEFYTCAAMILMTYLPFHLLLKEYSGSFNFVELFALLNLNAIFVIYWAQKWVDFTGVTKDLAGQYEDRLELLIKGRPATTGYLPEILLFFSPYMVLNIAAVLYAGMMYVSKRKVVASISSLVMSCLIMLIVVIISNLISPFAFNIPYFIFHQ